MWEFEQHRKKKFFALWVVKYWSSCTGTLSFEMLETGLDVAVGKLT